MNVRWGAEVYTANLFRTAASGLRMQINGRGSRFPLAFACSFSQAEVDEAPKSLNGAASEATVSLHAPRRQS